MVSNNRNLAIIAVAVIIIAVVAVAAWQLTGSDDPKEEPADSTDVSLMAANLADNYNGGFGDMYVADGATASEAVVKTDNDSSRLANSSIKYTVSGDASSQFQTIKATLDSMEGFMGATPVEITGIEGFDGICAYRMDVRMGTMTSFTLVYFAAYSGEILLDASEDALYFSGAIASDAEVSYLFESFVNSLTLSCEPMAEDASAKAQALVDGYQGGFGTFYLSDGATTGSASAMTDNDSSRLANSVVTFTVADDAASQFQAIKATLDSMEGFMGATPVEITGIEGFDGICAYRMDVRMGTMTSFTLVYFVAYSGDVLVDCSADPAYFSGALAEDSDIQALFAAVVAAVEA